VIKSVTGQRFLSSISIVGFVGWRKKAELKRQLIRQKMVERLESMINKLLLTAFVCTSFIIAVRADEERPQRRNKGQLTEEQRTLMKELRAKYDKNKDGKLDETERKAMTAEDKERMAKAGFVARKRKDKDGN
jgi:hypothetical protein